MTCVTLLHTPSSLSCVQLDPKYGKQLGGIKQHLDELDGNAAMDELESVGALKFDVNGTEVELTKEDLLIDMAQKPGYVSGRQLHDSCSGHQPV